jgi:SAM-dependent methyltransferase
VGDYVLEVPSPLWRSGHDEEASWIRSATDLLELAARTCGLADLQGRSVLDVGCGTKMVKAILEQDIGIDRYVGIDIDEEVISFLTSHVTDPRFAFHLMDVQNDMYNKGGQPLSERTELPVGGERFDITWLFSVFTHLGPTDFRAMLQLLRPCAKDDGWLVFSLYINEPTGTGHGPLGWTEMVRKEIDPYASYAAILEAYRQKGDEWLLSEVRRHVAKTGVEQVRAQFADMSGELAPILRNALDQVVAEGRADDGSARPAATGPARFIDEQGHPQVDGEPPDYVDSIPTWPLAAPLYSRRYAHQLIEGTGWEVVALHPPEGDYIQHYFVCRPA